MQAETVKRFISGWVLILAVLCLLSAGTAEAASGPEVNGDWRVDRAAAEELERFLSSARVVEVSVIGMGINDTRKLVLREGDRTMKAVFRNVEVYQPVRKDRNGMTLNFRDSAQFEVAAYKLSRLLGLLAVPPTVVRRFRSEDFENGGDFRSLGRRRGTVQAWVDNATTEGQRRRKGSQPPEYRSWGDQFRLMSLFDNLIANSDRNAGNILIDSDWRVWFIDATRSFRTISWLPTPDRIQTCDRRLWVRLNQITESELTEELESVLSGAEIRCLVRRLEALRELVGELIDRYGEAAVLRDYDLPSRAADADGGFVFAGRR